MTRSLRVTLLVVAAALAAGALILSLRLTQGVRSQKIGATIVRRPGLQRAQAARAGKSATPPARPNLAPLATVTVSSVEEGSLSSEGVADDLPDEQQWVSAGETAGAWVQLEWDDPVVVSEIELHDRPSTSENVLAGTLLFDDGAAIAVPPLPPDGSAWRTTFPPKTIHRVKFRIDIVQGHSAGLAEIMVYGPVGH